MGSLVKTLESWIAGNMFSFKKGDGAAYFTFYIFIPVVITAFSLSASAQSDIEVVYCYVTILVSAFNCIYDAANRWCSGTPTFKNSKLLLVIAATVVVAAYCIVIIFGMLITKSRAWICDQWLLAYFVVVVIAFADIIACFAKDTAWKACVASTEMEEVR